MGRRRTTCGTTRRLGRPCRRRAPCRAWVRAGPSGRPATTACPPALARRRPICRRPGRTVAHRSHTRRRHVARGGRHLFGGRPLPPGCLPRSSDCPGRRRPGLACQFLRHPPSDRRRRRAFRRRLRLAARSACRVPCGRHPRRARRRPSAHFQRHSAASRLRGRNRDRPAVPRPYGWGRYRGRLIRRRACWSGSNRRRSACPCSSGSNLQRSACPWVGRHGARRRRSSRADPACHHRRRWAGRSPSLALPPSRRRSRPCAHVQKAWRRRRCRRRGGGGRHARSLQTARRSQIGRCCHLRSNDPGRRCRSRTASRRAPRDGNGEDPVPA